jgi:TPR repeat protein
MRKLRSGRDCVIASLALLVMFLEAKAQAVISAESKNQTTNTVVISAQRSVDFESYQATEARIRNILSNQAALSGPFLNWCVENRFAAENASAPGGRLPSQSGASLNTRLRCARAHIEAAGVTLKHALDAFDARDYTTALALFKQAYSKGRLPDAALMLAKMHLDGLGVPKDVIRGIKWLRETAESKFDQQRDTMRFNPDEPQVTNARVESALMLAQTYREGKGVPRDWAQAEKWYLKAVEFGFIPALDILGQAYLTGQDAEKNVSRAIDCFKRAADAGYGPAAYDLGKLYYVGAQGVNPDLKLAGAYFELAAKAGHAGALFAIGRMYELGEGVAAKKGDANAEFALGALHSNSKINQRDQVVATNLPPTGIPQSGDKTSTVATSIVRQNGQDGANGNPSRDEAPVDSSSDNVKSGLERSGARDQAPAGDVSVVRVTGLRAISWKSYHAMRAAISAYEKYKYLAPDAVFSFAVLPSVGNTLPPNVELRVRTKDGTEVPITLERGMLFQLPVLPDPDADATLVSNLKEGQLRIGLLLHSRSVPPEAERLGDIRLRNEISQAIRDAEHPNYDPMCWRKRGASQCRPRHVTVWYKPRAPASSAWLIEGNWKEALETNGDPDYPSYKIPVNAGHLGNDAIIEFAYKKPLGSVKQTVVMIYAESDR